MFNDEMQKALQADAEKLRAMGTDVSDPIFLEDIRPMTEIVTNQATIDAIANEAFEAGAAAERERLAKLVESRSATVEWDIGIDGATVIDGPNMLADWIRSQIKEADNG